jgi:hypothetical protein
MKNKKGNMTNNKLKIHKTTIIGFKQIVAMFESKDAKEYKDGIGVSWKKLGKYLSPISLSLLAQINNKTLKKAVTKIV